MTRVSDRSSHWRRALARIVPCIAPRARRLANRKAVTATVFALCVIPVLGFVALGVDLGRAVWAKSQLDLAANSAALTAVSAGANAYAVNTSASMVPAQQAGAQRFSAQAGAIPGVTINYDTVTVTLTGGTVNATVSYSASTSTYFAGIFGLSTIPASGTVAVARTNSPFFNIEILMDNSSSMAIAATTAGMTQLGQLVQRSPLFAAWGQSQACAFGCHFASNNNDFYGLAESNGIQLRIDVLNQAVEQVISTIQASPAAAQFQVGLYTLNTGLTTVFPLSTNLTTAAAAAAAITVPVTTAGDDADTNFPVGMPAMTTIAGTGGNGSTRATARTFVFIITDGVEDYYSGSNRIMAPFDPSLCTTLKNNNVQVLTLYTTYIPIPTNAFYNANVASFIGNVAPNLQACASSPQFFFQASDPASITASLQAMLQAALAAPAQFTK
jgi:Flp pilus assembly protein TadG